MGALLLTTGGGRHRQTLATLADISSQMSSAAIEYFSEGRLTGSGLEASNVLSEQIMALGKILRDISMVQSAIEDGHDRICSQLVKASAPTSEHMQQADRMSTGVAQAADGWLFPQFQRLPTEIQLMVCASLDKQGHSAEPLAVTHNEVVMGADMGADMDMMPDSDGKWRFEARPLTPACLLVGANDLPLWHVCRQSRYAVQRQLEKAARKPDDCGRSIHPYELGFHYQLLARFDDRVQAYNAQVNKIKGSMNELYAEIELTCRNDHNNVCYLLPHASSSAPSVFVDERMRGFIHMLFDVDADLLEVAGDGIIPASAFINFKRELTIAHIMGASWLLDEHRRV
ncbi:hypothetical protein SCUCBS95973_002368 [Sporothrix curviconia]|uniref:2EXR domain-containing protein n=1 Tax=Sporothrix curviconia TaxID=1260050 RepID=A0ABP0B690_9PEZI